MKAGRSFTFCTLRAVVEATFKKMPVGESRTGAEKSVPPTAMVWAVLVGAARVPERYEFQMLVAEVAWLTAPPRP